MGIIAFRKTVFDNNVYFEISRLMYAVKINENGSAVVMMEGMVTSAPDSVPFNSIEIMIPHEIEALEDKTETFLDKEIKENHYRSFYDIIDKEKHIVNLSGITVKIVPITLKYDNKVHEYNRILLNFRTPFKPSETKAFRILYQVPDLATISQSKMYGWKILNIDMGFYDKSMVEHANTRIKGIMEDKSKFASCSRVYIWIVIPENYEIMEVTPPIQREQKYDEEFLSKGKKSNKKNIALEWEYKSISWDFKNRTTLRIKKDFLGVIGLLGLIGFVLSLIVFIIDVLVPIINWLL